MGQRTPFSLPHSLNRVSNGSKLSPHCLQEKEIRSLPAIWVHPLWNAQETARDAACHSEQTRLLYPGSWRQTIQEFLTAPSIHWSAQKPVPQGNPGPPRFVTAPVTATVLVITSSIPWPRKSQRQPVSHRCCPHHDRPSLPETPPDAHLHPPSTVPLPSSLQVPPQLLILFQIYMYILLSSLGLALLCLLASLPSCLTLWNSMDL